MERGAGWAPSRARCRRAAARRSISDTCNFDRVSLATQCRILLILKFSNVLISS